MQFHVTIQQTGAGQGRVGAAGAGPAPSGAFGSAEAIMPVEKAAACA